MKFVSRKFSFHRIYAIDYGIYAIDYGIYAIDYGSPCQSPSPRAFADLTDVTLADEDTNSILADNDNRAIQGNVAMQVAPPGDQIWIKCNWRHLMTKFGSNAKFQDFDQISGF